jgi:predicted secreted protein
MAGLPDRIELAVGEQLTRELPGLATAGYRWDHEIDGDEGVVDVTWARGLPPGSTPPVGTNAPETLTIAARRPGTVDLKVFQHRSWEPPEKAINERRVTVVVGDR